MKQAVSENKLRGGYYTPAVIARFLASWAAAGGARSALEPSAGNGNIVFELLSLLPQQPSSSVTAVELDKKAVCEAGDRVRALRSPVSCAIHESDFFAWAMEPVAAGRKFDAVVGNPPFIRYQDFPEPQRDLAFELMRRLGFSPTRLSNAWLPFLAVACSLVADGGRLAMVIPAELFQVNYASELRERLATMFARVHIVTFRELVFPEIQQEVVLLLCENARAPRSGVQVHELSGVGDLDTVNLEELSLAPVKPVDHASEKWTKYFLDVEEIDLLRELRSHPSVTPLGNHVDIDVGVVTGDNDFFVIPTPARGVLGLESETIPLIGRSAALRGLTFAEGDFLEWSDSGRPAHLFYPTQPCSEAAQEYIRHGERNGVQLGYKCRIRNQWFVVPSVWRPDFFFLRQADVGPRLVLNQTGATCTDTLHRGRAISSVPSQFLAAGLTNSLTYAASEVMGRSYGGGVMTFEPTEVERFPLPTRNLHRLPVDELDRLTRLRETEKVLDVVDSVLLRDGLGLSLKDTRSLRAIWRKLSGRRKGRKRRVRSSA